MADLISWRDCPCDGCKANPCGHPAKCVKFALWLNKTVDAVPVVRCKDCKHYYFKSGIDENRVCGIFYKTYYGEEAEPEPDDFCSYGERKDNG